MSVTTACEVEVSISDLHAAIRAVLPHCEKPRLGDDVNALARVRLALGSELLVMATNGRTSAMAAVGLLEDSRAVVFAIDDGPLLADIHPAMLRDIAAGLTAQKIDGDLCGEARLTFDGPAADGQPGTLAARDIGGLWLGSLTERPLLPLASDYPDIEALLRGALHAAEGVYKPLVTDSADLAAFAAASKAYKLPLQVEPVGQSGQRGWLVICGPDFIGSLSGSHHDDDSLSKRDTYRRRHLERHGLASWQEELV